MSLIDYESLVPEPTSEKVMPKFVGGPQDGLIGKIIHHTGIPGTVPLTSGEYSLQGFRSLNASCLAVYEWMPRTAKKK
jgi:hypothetical protein